MCLIVKSQVLQNGEHTGYGFSYQCTPAWKGIEYGLELLKGVIWRVGNGHTVNVWRDPWIPRLGRSRVPLSRKGNCRFTKVAHFLLQDGRWNEERLREFLPADVEEIMKIRVLPRQTEDFLAWGLEKSGLFTVRSA